jgi:hypothetical protein
MSKKAKGNDTANRKASAAPATRVVTTLRIVPRGRGFKKTWERRTV